ncbi:hypothetical protein LNV09_16485 [Paucibacter sp. B2R-40]|uniref:hypothetical protein n=1 Tax=Paucibacter sp. B2R-40 TaxID=2893554 RepID=UPI0021E4FE73|nr:hypothetical protein [Paucibacter sp. B2R-40]MCV2355742.1 hypothetical protein [Paucibacter sp. B2R-40]
MFALNKFIATSQHYFVTPMPSDAKVPSTTGSGFDNKVFAGEARGLPMEQLTMAALLILSGLNLANSILAV